MCHFITASVPESADNNAIASIAASNGRRWSAIPDSAISRRLPAGTRYFLTTPGHCDCGTALGHVLRTIDNSGIGPREINSMLRKGWSHRKITRWIAEKTKAADRRKLPDPSAEIDAWRRLLEDALSSNATPQIGLILHFYSGSVADEHFDFGVQDVAMNAIDAKFLKCIEEDRLYLFHR